MSIIDIEAEAATRLAQFKAQHPGWRESQGHVCWRRLIKGNCAGTCYYTEWMIPPGQTWWADHLRVWIRGRRPVAIVSQPYDWEPLKAQMLADDTAKRGLTYTVSADASWHCPGRTVLIVITKTRSSPLSDP